jgi:riboflavin synthase
MFTGIVREVGAVEAVERSDVGARVRLRGGLAGGLSEGDSVAVDGVCLTVAGADAEGFAADVMNQTLALTTLGSLEPGDPVNLEPPLRAGEPLGGHLVQGHVDGTGQVLAIEDDGFAKRVRVEAPGSLGRYIVEHGSVTLAGVSLTVSGLDDGGFEVSLIPETLEGTTLGRLSPGGRVNIEVDMIARHVERLMQGFRIGGER